MLSKSNTHKLLTPPRRLETGGFILTERTTPPEFALLQHTHEFTTITFILKGSCTETIKRRSQECSPLSLQILPAGERHSLQCGLLGAKCMTISISQQKLEAIRLSSDGLDQPAHLQGGVQAALALRVYREFRLRDDASPLSIEGLVLEIIGELTRNKVRPVSSSQPRWLREVRDLIHEHFAEDISLISISESAGIHPTYLARMFRKHYSCTVGEYVRQLRLDYAMQQLIHSHKSLAEIAANAGFYDQSHLTRALKLHMGTTPAKFRDSLKRV
ncbi:MAG: AraC family transcriptional regulator [Thermoproteota archaeon]|nr:AraC family transcriptional regulator [Thermoproteota archaeon]